MTNLHENVCDFYLTQLPCAIIYRNDNRRWPIDRWCRPCLEQEIERLHVRVKELEAIKDKWAETARGQALCVERRHRVIEEIAGEACQGGVWVKDKEGNPIAPMWGSGTDCGKCIPCRCRKFLKELARLSEK